MKYSLRSLMVALGLVPPLLAAGYFLMRQNWCSFTLMLFITGLIAFWFWSGGLSESSRIPP